MAPKLAFLTLSRLDFLYVDDLLSYLRDRRDREVGLKWLIVRACRVRSEEHLSGFKEVVKEIGLGDLEEMGSDSEGSLDTEDFEEHPVYGRYY